MPDLPPNITDAGPLHEQPDPHDGYDAYEWLQEASEFCLHTVHAERGGARIDNMKRAKDALTNAISMAADDVLKRWMSVVPPDREGRVMTDAIDPREPFGAENVDELLQVWAQVGLTYDEFRACWNLTQLPEAD